MSDENTPSGPDFSAGIPAADIAEGKMLQGHVGDEAVLIARAGGTLFAIGAECTHYHGPLAEGLIDGETVHCPWHHACFSLRTGQALAAPAVDPVSCWIVEEAGGRVFVKSKQGDAPAPVPRGSGQRVVIVGGGAAGYAAAELLRREAFAGDVTVLSDDADAPYDRPNCSKDYLAGEAPQEWMPLREDSFYADRKIDLRLNTEVAAIDAKAKTVSVRQGASLAYDVLILATGAEPGRPPIPGLDGPNAYTLRSLKDADAIIAAAEKAKRVAVIGASFIGLETAGALRQRGLEVNVIAPEDVPLERIVGRALGEWVRGVHEAKGVVFHLGRKVSGYEGGHVKMDQGDPVAADFIVVGTGVRPRVALAEAAGLKVDNGVVVDDHLRTSAEGVYAAGDVARYPDPVSGKLIRVEHWVHAERQGQYLARLILGDDRPFGDSPFFWSSHYDKSIRHAGHAEAFDTPEVEGSIAGEDAAVRFKSGGRLLAVATVGRDLENLKAQEGFDTGR
ncbi:MAG TPA: FAD-dependent oxidoreductase [Caulobacteraceae bacterium]|jgi:NADPH-dependent 2,4-dienoyl-CoA reductase/sulfur reductase-like enzyme/nitrite reductase/ring-hydroxylating ferredoxin subunit|nr:FAD-dependent oxidoreductase [Caulobacteraceae bacterium]